MAVAVNTRLRASVNDTGTTRMLTDREPCNDQHKPAHSTVGARIASYIETAALQASTLLSPTCSLAHRSTFHQCLVPHALAQSAATRAVALPAARLSVFCIVCSSW